MNIVGLMKYVVTWMMECEITLMGVTFTLWSWLFYVTALGIVIRFIVKLFE